MDEHRQTSKKTAGKNVRKNTYGSTQTRSQKNRNQKQTQGRNQSKTGKKTHRTSAVLSRVMFFVQLVISVLFFAFLLHLNAFPTKYMAVIALALIILLLISLIVQVAGKGKIFGIIYSTLISLLLVVGSAYVVKTQQTMNKVSNNTDTVVTEINFLVRSDSSAQSLNDVGGLTFGLQSSMDQTEINEAVADIEKSTGATLTKTYYNSYVEAANALLAEEVDVIAFNEGFRSVIEDQVSGFTDSTRVLASYSYERDVSRPDDSHTYNNSSDTSSSSSSSSVQVSDTYVVYLSGNDSYGEVSLSNGRTDVNILAVINTRTRKIQLITTPRDYYIDLPVGGTYYKDKLTHAGIYGIDVSEQVLSELYDVNIDHYIRVNFSGFEQIVDALGGVNVYSDYTFTSSGGYSFVQGYNQVNGAQALAFVRERYAFPDGDYQRGRDQMYMIQAILEKATSSAVLTNYLSVMDSISGCFLTDFSQEEISALVKMELEDSTPWTISTLEVSGIGNMAPCYSLGGLYASVQEIDETAVEEAKQLISAVLNGQ